jgi:uncharacterized membrane protein (DUF485 family)
LLGAIPITTLHPHFFANPVIDGIRIGCVVFGVLLVCWTVRVVAEEKRRRELAPGQACRFAALALAAVSISYTEIVVQGTAVTWRLPINVAVLILGFIGIHLMRREQKRR